MPAPLTGTKHRIAKEVEDWATSSGVKGDNDAVLAGYNEAAEAAPGRLGNKLMAAAHDDQGRRALIALLGRSAVSDEGRLLVLDALENECVGR